MTHREPNTEAVVADRVLGRAASSWPVSSWSTVRGCSASPIGSWARMWDAEDIVADAMVRWLTVDREPSASRRLPDDHGDTPGA